MRIAPDLLSVGDLEDAVASESFATRALIPEDVQMWGLLNHEGAAEWALRRCNVEFVPVPGQVVSVRKQRHGVRPVAELFMRDRLLYRTLVRRWKNILPDPDRSSNAYETFLKAPLDLAVPPKYVVSSDVTACYQYIDHGLLARELLSRTGDSDGVAALTALLAGLIGRSFGLPQQSEPSDALAEAYLSAVERRLVRQGLTVWRYNDDFRIAADSWRDALNVVDALEHECRTLGLALNDAKTVIRKRETYETALGRRDKVKEEIAERVQIDLTTWLMSPYGGDITFEEPEEGDVTVAHAVVDDWYEFQRRPADQTADEHEQVLVLGDLLRWALPVLRSQPTDEKVLRACALMLRTEQTLTPLVARYLAKAGDKPSLTISWFEAFLANSPYLTPWQVWWVAPALREVKGAYADGSMQRAWLEGAWNDHTTPEPVRAGLALSVAEKGLVSADDLVRVYDSMTETGRPYIARALGAIAPAGHPGAATLLVEDDWVKWAFETGQP
jgi:RNA-directed DNA polymerase